MENYGLMGFYGSLWDFMGYTLWCHQTWLAGKSHVNGGFDRKITELNGLLLENTSLFGGSIPNFEHQESDSSQEFMPKNRVGSGGFSWILYNIISRLSTQLPSADQTWEWNMDCFS